MLHVDQFTPCGPFAPCGPVCSMWTSLLHVGQFAPCGPVFSMWTSLLHVDHLLHVDQFAPCGPVCSMWTSLLHMGQFFHVDQFSPYAPVYSMWTSLLHVDQFALKTEALRFKRNFGNPERFKIFTEELGNIQVFCDITLFRIPDHEDGRTSLFQNVGILAN